MVKEFNIGVFVNDYHGYYPKLITKGILEQARTFGVNIIFYSPNYFNDEYVYQDQEKIVQNYAFSHDFLDGYIVLSGILASAMGKKDFSEFMQKLQGKPIISIGVETECNSSILVDNESGIDATVEHLVNHHQFNQIAFIGGPDFHFESKSRYQAFKKALTKYGLSFDENLFYEGDFLTNSGALAVEEFIEKRQVLPQSIVAANDEMAVGVIQELQRRNINVPDEVAVIGFDDLEHARFVQPPLSTVCQPLAKMGRTSVELMVQLLNGEDVPEKKYVEADLIIRNSCGCKDYLQMGESSLMGKENINSYLLLKGELMKRYMKHCPGDELELFLNEHLSNLMLKNVGHQVDDEFFFDSLNKLIELFNNYRVDPAEIQNVLNMLSDYHEDTFGYADDKSHALFKKARLYLSNKIEKYYEHLRFRDHYSNWNHFEFEKAMALSSNTNELWPIYTEYLKSLGVKYCVILQYPFIHDLNFTPKWKEPEEIICRYVYHNGKRVDNEQKLVEATKDFIPEEYLPQFNFQLFVRPLFFKGSQYGYIIFDLQEKIQPYTYDRLRFQVAQIMEKICLKEDSELSQYLIKEENYKYKHLLRLSNQGILKFNEELSIYEDYSSICMEIFNRPLSGNKFSQLLYPKNEEAANIMDSIFLELLLDENVNVTKTIDQLPSILSIGEKEYDITYKLFKSLHDDFQKEITIILTDVTAERILESQSSNPGEMTLSSTHFVRDYPQLVNVCSNFKDFLSELKQGECNTNNTIAHLVYFKEIMQYFKLKGSEEGVLEFLHSVSKSLAGNKGSLELNSAQILNVETRFEEEYSTIESYVEKYQDTQSEGYFDTGLYREMESFFKAWQEGEEPDSSAIKNISSKFITKSLKEYFSGFNLYLTELSQELERQVLPVDFQCDDVRVAPGKWEPFIWSLLQLFRNAVEHGIESEEERIELGKPGKGMIAFKVSSIANNMISLRISDDGRGIDSINMKMLAENLMLPTDEEIPLDIIFENGISSKWSESPCRGYGLGVVKQELDKLDGKVHVSSQQLKGTAFEFLIPLDNEG